LFLHDSRIFHPFLLHFALENIMVFAIYIYTFFVFSKIDKNTVFTVSVHDQNTVSLPKLLNEAKVGKISHCAMMWIFKQNTNMKLWKMCCFQRLSYKTNLFFFSVQNFLDYIKFILHKFERKKQKFTENVLLQKLRNRHCVLSISEVAFVKEYKSSNLSSWNFWPN